MQVKGSGGNNRNGHVRLNDRGPGGRGKWESEKESDCLEKIFLNGNIYTENPEQPHAKAVAPDAEIIDLGGRTVLPGVSGHIPCRYISMHINLNS